MVGEVGQDPKVNTPASDGFKTGSHFLTGCVNDVGTHGITHIIDQVDDHEWSDGRIRDVTDFQVTQVGGYLVTRLRHSSQEDRSPTFELSQESDGTLRILGLLAELFQDPPRTLIAMEEPELTMHPGAMGLLCDVLSESTRRSQILITTHSPDLIARFGADELRVVEKVEGSTVIGEVDEAQRTAINERLFSPGDLLRLDGSLRRAMPAAQEKSHA